MLSAETESVEISSSNENYLKENYHLSNVFEGGEFQLSVHPPAEEVDQAPMKPQRYRQALFEQETYERADSFDNEHPITQQQCGYSNLRDTINDDETAMNVFKIMDINKDSFITKSDLKTFLEYLNEPYLQEELDEMIRMFDLDSENKVGFDVFKQFAKGEIIGLTNSFSPNEEIKSNQKILKNMMEFSDIESFQSQEFKKSVNKGLINSSKIISSKEVPLKSKINVRPDKKVMNQQVFKERKEEIRKYVHISMESLPHLFSQYQNKMLSFSEIVTIFNLDKEVASRIYDKEKVISSLQLFIEYISSTTISSLQKIEKSLNIFTRKHALTIQELGSFLELMMPYEFSEVWERRARTLLQKSNIDLGKSIGKEVIINLMLEYRMIFRF